MYEKTVFDMVSRFDNVFRVRKNDEARRMQVAEIMDHLRRHTRRRRGDLVLQEGYVEWEQTSRIYDLFRVDLNFCERIFFTVDVGESTAVLSKICSFILILGIAISIFSWMVSTLPAVQSIEESCTSIKTGECAPETARIFKLIESVCVITFTVEYVVRLLTVHSVRFALLNEVFMEALLSGSNVKEVKFMRSDSHTNMDQTRTNSGLDKDDGTSPPPKLDGKLKTLFFHIIGFSNMIDLLAILPFWLETFNAAGGGGFLVVLRILRLTRVFRVFKLGKYNDVFTLFSRVIVQSMPALLLMVFFILLGCCLFGTLMWFAEAGAWYPGGNPVLKPLGIEGRGAWLRHTGSLDEDDFEESPFQSIIHSFWYVLVTITTVGYGDVGPTTAMGKIIATVAILNGIIVLAMPIGVVGANFGSEYFHVVEDRKRRQRLKQQLDTRAMLEEQEDAALNEEPTEQEVASLPDQTATELLRVDIARKSILVDAEELDKSWETALPPAMYAKLSDHLRFFVMRFIGGGNADSTQVAPEVTGFAAKPKIQMAHLLDLDALSTQVSKAISTVQSCDELAKFGLRESLECRRKMQHFIDCCWEYATTKCTIEKHQESPDYFQMKNRLATKATTEVTMAPRKTS